MPISLLVHATGSSRWSATNPNRQLTMECSWERSQELDAKIVAVGETEGIRFAFDRIERTPTTVDAHRLIWLADQQGCQDTIVESLFGAYFTEGRDIINRQTLIDVVAEAGLERQLAEAVLNSEEGIMKQVEWRPPVLTFLIERHGGIVLGSTRAELQQWSVDLERQTATCERARHRQLSRMAKRVEVGFIVAEVAGRILVGEADNWLSWLGDGRVRVETGRIFPEGSGFKQTVQRRRRRFKDSLIERLSTKGWTHLGRNTFARTTPL